MLLERLEINRRVGHLIRGKKRDKTGKGREHSEAEPKQSESRLSGVEMPKVGELETSQRVGDNQS